MTRSIRPEFKRLDDLTALAQKRGIGGYVKPDEDCGPLTDEERKLLGLDTRSPNPPIADQLLNRIEDTLSKKRDVAGMRMDYRRDSYGAIEETAKNFERLVFDIESIKAILKEWVQ
jgi:hypothetical protein